MRQTAKIQEVLMEIAKSKQEDHSETYQVERMLVIIIEVLLDIRETLRK